jgi:hypothetical protein
MRSKKFTAWLNQALANAAGGGLVIVISGLAALLTQSPLPPGSLPVLILC